MSINWNYFLVRTRSRDVVVFFLITILINILLQLTLFEFLPWNFNRLLLSLIIIGQFYLAALVTMPVGVIWLRKLCYWLFFVLDYLIFRELLLELTPSVIFRLFNFEAVIVVLFILSLFSRGIRMYFRLREQLVLLNSWTQRKILFRKPEKIKLNIGEAGEFAIHPNELVYVRTKAAGDHTKIFGIKHQQPQGITPRLTEYETTAFRNFEQIFKVLEPFRQFKRIHQSTVINTIYPFEQKDGILKIEGRRFNVSRNSKFTEKFERT